MNKYKFLSAAVLAGLLSACGSSSTGSNDSGNIEPPVINPPVTEPPVTEPKAELVIHMIGDSTKTAYELDRRPQMGWGEALPTFFDADKTDITNWALGGRSSRSFYSEASRWPTIKPTLSEGDYVIIQFGHNDQKKGGDYDEYGTYAYCSDGTNDGEGCADVEHSYYQFLKKYVEESRAQGAIPILMSPIVRNYPEGNTISAKGQHNFSDYINTDETVARGNYPEAMQAVATKYSVPYVNLTDATRKIVESYGTDAASDSLYIAADSTHPQVLFANLIAKAAVDGLKTQSLLENFMVDATSLIASPDALAWGDRYIDTPINKELTISAFDLTPTEGTITVTAPDGFMLSDDKTADNWKSAFDIKYSNGAFTEKLYVQFTPTEAKSYESSITFNQGGESLDTLAVSGKGVAVGSGLPSYSSWFTGGSSLVGIVDGAVTPADVIESNLEAGSTKTLAVDGQDTTVARYRAVTASRVDANYLQFAVTASGQPFKVSNISAYLTSSGGSTVQADIEYSLSSDFASPVKLNAEPLAFTKDAMTLKEFQVTAEVAVGESIYVRIYPWNTAGTSGKYLGLYDVKIKGLSGE